MKSSPILFNAAMVRAQRSGIKTQTRRLYKNRKHPDIGCDMAASELVREAQHVINRACPYGQPGDRLWVREAFRTELAYDHIKPKDLPVASSGKTLAVPFWYAADLDGEVPFLHAGLQGGKLRPSMFMPRAASRTSLEVVTVRVERLQDISEADAIAEGAQHNGLCDHARRSCDEIGCFGPNSYRGGFCELWESLNGPGSWAANPWVWVIDFQEIDRG